MDSSGSLSTPSARRATLYPCGQFVLLFISIHALREEGDYAFAAIPLHMVKFLSTPSARRATVPVAHHYAVFFYFYPRPPRGGRRSSWMPTTDCRSNFYPRPPRGGRRVFAFSGSPTTCISIHALREEGDQRYEVSRAWRDDISIHALREEGDSSRCCRPPTRSPFLSTPSARRATLHDLSAYNEGTDFYPRPPRGGRPRKNNMRW